MSDAYTPHPGGRIDRSANIEEHATGPSEHHAEALVQESQSFPMEPVSVVGNVHVEAAAEAFYRTTVLAAGSSPRQILPQDPKRLRAVILSIDQDIVICSTKELAQDSSNQATNVPFPTGYYLPKGTSLEIKNWALLWAVNTSGSTATRVSVMVEHADPRSHRSS